jgi:hypothetical protein
MDLYTNLLYQKNTVLKHVIKFKKFGAVFIIQQKSF